MMAKFALLVSVAAGVVTLVILILAVAEAEPETTHTWVPSLSVPEMILVQVVPPSLEMSIFKLPVTLIDVQVIVWVEPTGQLSPPLGEVTVIDAGGAGAMVKLALLVSRTAGKERLLILILAVAVVGVVTTHACVPSLVVEARRVVQVVPPSLDRSILTLPATPTDVQVIVWVVPTFQVSPPLGAVTVID